MSDRSTPDERRFRALASGGLETIAEVDSFGRRVYSNENREETRSEQVHPDDRDSVSEHFARAYGNGSYERLCFRILEEDGSIRWAEVTLSPFETDGNRHVMVMSRDVTEARHTEQELRDSRERYQRIVEASYDMVVECDSNWKITRANDRVAEIFGSASSQYFSNPSVVHPDDRDRTVQAFRQINDGADSAQVTFRCQHVDGSWRWVDISVRVIDPNDPERNLLIIGRDVTAQEDAKERLRESEKRYRDLVESSPLGIFVVQEGRVVYTNPAGALLAGTRRPDDLVGHELRKMLDIGDAARVARRMQHAPLGARDDSVEFEITGLDGKRRRVQGAATLTSYGGQPAFQSTLRDITDLEHARQEQERLQLQLQEARKLESLGVLAGGIAHDFNNLLAVILTNVRFAREESAPGSDGLEALVDAEQAADSAARLVRQLLAYAGRRTPEVKSVELSELAESISELLNTAVPENVSLAFDLSAEPLYVHADLVQLEQVLMNLVLNATDALGEEPGTVTVRTLPMTLCPEDLSNWRGAESLGQGEYACVEVADTGAGMNAEVQARIFDPFFTTKREGHGLGLSAVLGLVQGHGGGIQVESVPAQGTRIRIALPLESQAGSGSGAGGPFVLVAEGDDHFRARAEEALKELGARVCAAGDAEGALGLLAMHAEELDAALIDVDLFTQDATPLVRAVHNVLSELPILLLHDRNAEPSPDLCAQAFAQHARTIGQRSLRSSLESLLEKCRDDSGRLVETAT